MTSHVNKQRAVGFSLGSNEGDPIAQLYKALDALHESDGIELIRASSFFETSPWGDEDQPQFLNLCATGVTFLAAEALLDTVKTIETRLGRVPTRRWGPRLIDIDILYLGNDNISSKTLTVPHPYMLERLFVLMPLAEIAPDLVIEDIAIKDPLSQMRDKFYTCRKLVLEKWQADQALS